MKIFARLSGHLFGIANLSASQPARQTDGRTDRQKGRPADRQTDNRAHRAGGTADSKNKRRNRIGAKTGAPREQLSFIGQVALD